MTLTTLEAFRRYSELTWYGKVFIKRYSRTLDAYESNWQDISAYMLKDSIKSISKKLPQDNYSYGSVIIDNCNFEFRNVYGELSDESNDMSLFKGYQRHDSLIKVQMGYVDRTDEYNRENIEVTVFNGLIDDKEAMTTKNYTEKFRAKDRLEVLKRITMADLGSITATNIADFVYFAMNRDAITKYGIVVNSSTDYINPGFDDNNCDFSQYDKGDTIFDVFSNLAIGHSIFYIDNDTDIFNFKSITPTVAEVVFEDILEKRIQVDNYMTGVDKTIEKWYWEDTNLSSISSIDKYNTSEIINVKAITQTAARQSLLDTIRSLTETPKLNFDIIIPFFPIINIQGKIRVVKKGVIPQDAFILGVGRLGIDRLRRPVGAIAISATQTFYVRGVKHNKLQTTISVQAI